MRGLFYRFGIEKDHHLIQSCVTATARINLGIAP
jgi:hypothetical protein